MSSMTTKQVMSFLQVKRDAVRGLVKKGKLRMTKVGNRNLFIEAQVKALLTGEAKIDESK